MATDTATLKDYALRLFAHRTIANATVIDNPEAAVISFVRFFDSNGDYIQLPVCRNFCPDQAGGDLRTNIFDDTGGSEADPEFATWTQYYHDLNLAVFVPRFNKTYDVDAYSWGYSASPFTVVDYKLYNAGGNVVAEAADATIGFTITKGTRYLLRFKIRVFNDMVEQSIGENTRSIITTSGLKTILRRVLHDNSPQELGRPPMFVGVGGEGAYYIDNASDGRWRYDASASSYTVTTTTLFPSPSAAGDAFAFCREETDSDKIEGIYFDISTPGVLSTGASTKWQYWNGTAWASLHGVVDDTVDLDPDSASYGSPLAIDGAVRWLSPTDIDVDAELKAGTVGCYYRCLLVGDKFSTNPVLSSKAEPLVYRTVQSETAMQQPFIRKTADIIGVPYTGNASKVSAEFGIGAIPERYDSEGLLIAKSFVPTRETATFTTEAIISEENISIVEATDAVVADGLVSIPVALAEPLKILTIIDTTSGELMPVVGKVLTAVEREVTGINYIVSLKGVVDGTYDIKFLAKTISPTVTPLNIISVTGNTQTILGPEGVFVYASENNPADTDGGGDTRLNPKLIMKKGVLMGVGGSSSSQFGEGILASPTKYGFGQVTKKETPLTGASGSIGGMVAKAFGVKDAVHEYAWAVDYIKMTAGYPLIMLNFNISDFTDLNNPNLMVSIENSTTDGGTAGAFIWTTGNPKSQAANDKETAWRNLGYTKSRSVDIRVTQNIIIPLDLQYVEKGDGTRTSPVVDGDGNIFIMLAPSNKDFTNGKLTIRPEKDAGRRLSKEQVKKSVSNLTSTGIAKLGTLTLHYASISFTPVKNLRDEVFNFRRGIDWKYVLGEETAEWVKQSPALDDFAVETLDGNVYYPVLPSMLFWEREETYFFTDITPPAKDNIDLYVKDMPVDAAGVYVWLELESKIVDTTTDEVVVNSVTWDDDAIWNNVDYEVDHHEAGTGEGAGIINVTFKTKHWKVDEHRKVGIRYLAQAYPNLSMTYLVDRGLMFSRAHFSPLSFSPVVTPDYGDRLRVYFEVQFGHKRSA
jgi:hypothetical protein